jgi:hypothetical protein
MEQAQGKTVVDIETIEKLQKEMSDKLMESINNSAFSDLVKKTDFANALVIDVFFDLDKLREEVEIKGEEGVIQKQALAEGIDSLAPTAGNRLTPSSVCLCTITNMWKYCKNFRCP